MAACRATIAAAGTPLGSLLLGCALALAVALALVPVASASSARPNAGAPTREERALLDSHELWATIDVCDPQDQPDTLGIRGSMPGNGHAKDRMFMSFRLQYRSAAGQWTNLAGAAASGWVSVGAAGSPRQGGNSFDLKPAQGKPPVTLRGVVDFQWRHGKTLLFSATRTTTADHKSLAGADPAGFSAATCAIG